MIEPVTTGQIYWGSVPFIVIQLLMVGAVMAFPGMVMHYKGDAAIVDPNSVSLEVGGGDGASAYGRTQSVQVTGQGRAGVLSRRYVRMTKFIHRRQLSATAAIP